MRVDSGQHKLPTGSPARGSACLWATRILPGTFVLLAVCGLIDTADAQCSIGSDGSFAAASGTSCTIPPGQTIAAPLGILSAIYISEYDLYKIRGDAGARIQVQGQLRTWLARVVSIAARPVEIDPKLVGEAQLQGMNPPHYYIVDLLVSSEDGVLKPGMTGVARVYGEKRSLLGLAWEGAKNFWERKIW